MKKAFTTILMAALCMSCYAQEPADTNLPPQALSIIIVKTGNLESANRVKARIDELKSDLPDFFLICFDFEDFEFETIETFENFQDSIIHGHDRQGCILLTPFAPYSKN